MKTDKAVNTKHTPEELRNELHLYFCAGGHTRSEMAKARLIEAGFRFDGADIYYPDGVKLVSDKSGNTAPHDWTVTLCKGFKRVARGGKLNDDRDGTGDCHSEFQRRGTKRRRHLLTV